MQPIEPSTFTWQRITMDVVGPLPETYNGNRYILVLSQPAHAHRSDVDISSIFCGKYRRKRYRPDIGNGTRVFDIDIVVRCTYDEIQTTIFIRERHLKYMLTMSNYT